MHILDSSINDQITFGFSDDELFSLAKRISNNTIHYFRRLEFQCMLDNEIELEDGSRLRRYDEPVYEIDVVKNLIQPFFEKAFKLDKSYIINTESLTKYLLKEVDYLSINFALIKSNGSRYSVNQINPWILKSCFERAFWGVFIIIDDVKSGDYIRATTCVLCSTILFTYAKNQYLNQAFNAWSPAIIQTLTANESKLLFNESQRRKLTKIIRYRSYFRMLINDVFKQLNYQFFDELPVNKAWVFIVKDQYLNNEKLIHSIAPDKRSFILNDEKLTEIDKDKFSQRYTECFEKSPVSPVKPV